MDRIRGLLATFCAAASVTALVVGILLMPGVASAYDGYTGLDDEENDCSNCTGSCLSDTPPYCNNNCTKSTGSKDCNCACGEKTILLLKKCRCI